LFIFGFGLSFLYADSAYLKYVLLEKGAKGFKMSEKKVVGRNVAIALGIICIVLAVGRRS